MNICQRADAEIVPDAEHDGARTGGRSAVPRRTSDLATESTADVQLDGQAGTAGLATAGQSTGLALQAPDEEGRPRYRTRTVAWTHDQGRPRVWPRHLRHRRRQGQCCRQGWTSREYSL